MNRADWERAKSLLAEAAERPADVRERYIIEHCGDEALLAEILALLAYSAPLTDIVPADALRPGERLGAYVIEGRIGSGGMGEVYRARDSRLGRDVAIKVLPPAFAADRSRLARFEREGKLLASLQHPNICTLFDIGHQDGTDYLVMELIDGESLAERLDKGALPLDQAIRIGIQIADALDKAHRNGIVHRDLKPGNVMVTRSGAKLLDFGIARGGAAIGPPAPPRAASALPPRSDLTEKGAVIGTRRYMSPEQLEGRDADSRSDIWALGCLLNEMLAGRLAESPALEHVVSRCLAKAPDDRWQSAADVRHELTWIAALGNAVPGRAVEIPTNGRWWKVAVAIALIGTVGIGAWRLARDASSATPARLVHLSIPAVGRLNPLPYGTRHLAIADDGSCVAYAAGDQLWIRRIDRRDAVAINIAGSINPFFSPHGDWVGFFDQTGGETGLKKVSVLGGAPVSIVPTTERSAGATWRADGTIVFATSTGLYQVSNTGGPPRLLAKPDPRRKERIYAWPRFLPDGRAVLFTIVPNDSIDGAEIAVLDLTTLNVRIVLKGGSAARYTPTGHLVYASGETLEAVAFDAERQQTRGTPVALSDIAIATTPDNGAAEFAVSDTGTLLFVPPSASREPLRTLSWVDRHGNQEPLSLSPGRYEYARVSPDGTRVALDIPGANRDIWIWNLQRHNLTRLTDGPTEDLLPLWSQDSSRVFFASNRAGTFNIYSQAADGAAQARLEFAGSGSDMPSSLTPDGTRLLVVEDFKALSLLNLTRPDRLEPLLHGELNYWLGAVSPDGNWMAYESNESGHQVEIFIRPFPDVRGRREQVSIDGGRFPQWGPKGSDELYYVDRDGGMMAASVKLTPTLSLGRVTKLFDSQKPLPGVSGRPYDISPLDGRFLMVKPATNPGGSVDISVVLNWFEELKARR